MKIETKREYDFTIQDSFKVADILPSEISETALKALKDYGTTYKDRRLKEDIFSPQDTLDWFANENQNEEIQEETINELEQLQEALDEIGAAYVRVIYN